MIEPSRRLHCSVPGLAARAGSRRSSRQSAALASCPTSAEMSFPSYFVSASSLWRRGAGWLLDGFVACKLWPAACKF